VRLRLPDPLGVLSPSSVGAVYEAVKKLPIFTVQWSIVIFGCAFGAASIRNNARSATTDDK
jgi:hypothetical protein